ncbi:MAG: hypothetical protein ABSG95_14780 [Solirubrobacteraceae bacterium]
MALATVALGCPALAPALAQRGPMVPVRVPITPRHGRPFLPAIGDWEGTFAGYSASFELTYEPQYVSFRRPPYGYEDLTLLKPAVDPQEPGCPFAPRSASWDVIAQNEPAPLGVGGSFPLAGFRVSGGIEGPDSASISTREEFPGRKSAACVRTLRWTMHPAQRRTVDDGSWMLRFSDGETEQFSVSDGGRLATGIGYPAALGKCGGPIGSVDLFVGASGIASFHEPRERLAVSLNFSAEAAGGQIIASAARCGARRLAMSASLTERAP